MKFQNPSMHGSEVMLCIKKAYNIKMPKVTKGHNAGSIFQNLFKKVYEVIYSSMPIYSLSFNALALIVFEIIC